MSKEQFKQYQLIDSGHGEKLEMWGDVLVRRPDPQALWSKTLEDTEWSKAQAFFSRDSDNAKWHFANGFSLKKWPISHGDLNFWIKPTAFKHTGLFPEQVSNWKWMSSKIENCLKKEPGKEIEVLNLFAYTGGASLACAQAGAKVSHVDSSKSAVAWARENASLSGLDDKPIRWLIDDARDFVTKEIKRGRKYDAIIMDPPAFGHGPNKELWKIEDHFSLLIKDCLSLLKDKPLFFLINGYSAGYSATAYKNNILDLSSRFGGEIETGELFLEESRSKRLLPCGIYARWSNS